MLETWADLHTHSTCSDGTLSPEEVLDAADRAGLSWFSLTDHDTVEGIEPIRALITKNQLGIELIPGVELSSHDEEDGEIHILAYGFDPTNSELLEYMEEFRQQREIRLGQIIEQLAKLGFSMKVEDVLCLSQGASISRVHIAQAMQRYGYVKTQAEAFRLYLGNGRPAYIPRKKYSPAQIISLIHSWGAVAVMAHPNYFDQIEPDRLGVEKRLEAYSELGLDGFEAWHPHVSKKLKKILKRLAKRHGLILTGGSDSHGSWGDRPGIGSYKIGSSRVEALLARIREAGQKI